MNWTAETGTFVNTPVTQTPDLFSKYYLSPDTGDEYKITYITPQYFHYVGNVITYAYTTHTAPGGTDQLLVDFTRYNEAWVTIYFRPTVGDPGPNVATEKPNDFGTISPAATPGP